jgi:hypothetical protein
LASNEICCGICPKLPYIPIFSFSPCLIRKKKQEREREREEREKEENNQCVPGK